MDVVESVRWWRHPLGVAVRDPPVRAYDENGSSTSVYIWFDAEVGHAASADVPELLEEVKDLESLEVGDLYRWMHNENYELLDQNAKLKDVGGALCCWDNYLAKRAAMRSSTEEGTGAAAAAAGAAADAGGAGGADGGAGGGAAAGGAATAVDTLNPLPRLVGGNEVVDAEPPSTSKMAGAFAAVQRVVQKARFKVGVARARQAVEARGDTDLEEGGGVEMRGVGDSL